jgi:hypothetical protein
LINDVLAIHEAEMHGEIASGDAISKAIELTNQAVLETEKATKAIDDFLERTSREQ